MAVEIKERTYVQGSSVLEGHVSTVETGAGEQSYTSHQEEVWQEEVWQATHPKGEERAIPIIEIGSGLVTYFIDYFRYMPAATHWLILFVGAGIFIYFIANYTPIPQYFNTYHRPAKMEAVDRHLIHGVLKALPHRKGMPDTGLSIYTPPPAAAAPVPAVNKSDRHYFEASMQSVAVPGDQGPRIKHIIER